MYSIKTFCKLGAFSVVAWAVTLPQGAVAQDAAPPKAALCASCHGKNGSEPIMPTYPKIGGQNKEYLIGSLKAYKAGERKNTMAAVMTGQAAMLSDEEIEALAAYYATFE